jgi:GT2 family glycosyltransferase
VGGSTVNALDRDPYACASQLIVDMVLDHYNRERPRFFPSNNLALSADAFHAIGGFSAEFRTAEDRDLCDRWHLRGWPQLFAPEAVVEHAHGMDFAAFWAQHLGYGRGAHRYLRAHKQRTGDSSLDRSFYLRLLREIPKRLAQDKRPIHTATLLAAWQAANTSGFLLEAAKQMLGRVRAR